MNHLADRQSTVFTANFNEAMLFLDQPMTCSAPSVLPPFARLLACLILVVPEFYLVVGMQLSLFLILFLVPTEIPLVVTYRMNCK